LREFKGTQLFVIFVDFEGEKDKEGERIRDVLAVH
jgi:hypothetical protein